MHIISFVCKDSVNAFLENVWKCWGEKCVFQACMTVHQEQTMPNSSICSILGTSNQSLMAPSLELASGAWKLRSVKLLGRISMVQGMNKLLSCLQLIMFLIRSKQPCGLCRVGRRSSSPMALIPKSQATSSQTSWKEKKLAPFSQKWSQQVE